MQINKLIDVAYLPVIKDSILEDCDLNVLNEAYNFCNKFKMRSFCTYPDLVPMIESKNYITKLCSVISFPNGYDSPEEKLVEAGGAYQLMKKASGGEIDVVLHPEYPEDDLHAFAESSIWEKMDIKYIVGVCERDWKQMPSILENARLAKYIKTSTGRVPIPFKEKLDGVRRLRKLMEEKGINIPIKISGGIEGVEQMKLYTQAAGEDTIFGVSFSSVSSWPEFKG